MDGVIQQIGDRPQKRNEQQSDITQPIVSNALSMEHETKKEININVESRQQTRNRLLRVLLDNDPERQKRDEERLSILDEIFEHREQERRRLANQGADINTTTPSNCDLKSETKISSEKRHSLSSLRKLLLFTNDDITEESDIQTMEKPDDKTTKVSSLSIPSQITTSPNSKIAGHKQEPSHERNDLTSNNLNSNRLNTKINREDISPRASSQQTSPRREFNKNVPSFRRGSEVTNVEQIMKEQSLVARLQQQIAQSSEVTSNTSSEEDDAKDEDIEFAQDGRPFWIPDHQRKTCYNCGKKFSMMLRRHHCRNCGQIFCWKCCNTTLSLPHLHYTKPQRCCVHCVAQLTQTTSKK